MRGSVLVLVVTTFGVLGCMAFSPCGTSECCAGPGPVVVASSESLALADDTDDTDDTGAGTPRSLVVTMTGGAREVSVTAPLVDDGDGGWVLDAPVSLDGGSRCDFSAILHFELAPPDPERAPIDVPFAAGFNTSGSAALWDGWTVTLSSAGWIS